ncbi:MAG: IspD/TarI family cytidylyltransferase [Prevotella sp.]|nr:2-C-methyl-D-erythritol 4-phosphate cytidylyltransferase [Prevotella sp.]MDD7273988.1 IspD/TarI family cytidylyltransferase [Prevotellaceae bacterium]MDY3936223.1 IspD/TarI family cytidylyltransferase [Prevotella sp.]MDY4218092.1 IspD/TarI family cytidylyltransferase [Prevotella sp.]
MNIALLTAGGIGNRMGQDIPKQFMTIDNIPVIIYTMKAFQEHNEIDAIGVVCLNGWEVMLQAYANQFNITKLQWIFPSGETNQQSIRNGLLGLQAQGCKEDDIVLVHDGVRPLVSARIISENIRKCREFGYAVTGLVCKEAIMEVKGDCLLNIEIPRERLIRTQTPHTYRLRTLLEAHAEAQLRGIENTVASCTLLGELGVEEQHLVIGSERNGLKLTQTEDVELFKALKNTDKEDWMK